MYYIKYTNINYEVKLINRNDNIIQIQCKL